MIAANPTATHLLTGAGAGYLLIGASRMLRSACDGSAPPSLGCCRSTPLMTFLQAFCVSVLNPLVWVETVLVLSALASTLSLPMLPWFGLGAACGSLAKFSLLSFAARGLASLFVRRSLRRGFDALAGMAMLAMTLIVAWPMLSSATVQTPPATIPGKHQVRGEPTPSIGSAYRVVASCGQAHSECARRPDVVPLHTYRIE